MPRPFVRVRLRPCRAGSPPPGAERVRPGDYLTGIGTAQAEPDRRTASAKPATAPEAASAKPGPRPIRSGLPSCVRGRLPCSCRPAQPHTGAGIAWRLSNLAEVCGMGPLPHRLFRSCPGTGPASGWRREQGGSACGARGLWRRCSLRPLMAVRAQPGQAARRPSGSAAARRTHGMASGLRSLLARSGDLTGTGPGPGPYGAMPGPCRQRGPATATAGAGRA